MEIITPIHFQFQHRFIVVVRLHVQYHIGERVNTIKSFRNQLVPIIIRDRTHLLHQFSEPGNSCFPNAIRNDYILNKNYRHCTISKNTQVTIILHFSVAYRTDYRNSLTDAPQGSSEHRQWMEGGEGWEAEADCETDQEDARGHDPLHEETCEEGGLR